MALARERGAHYVDAEVTRLKTEYEIGPEVDVAQLVHTEQQRKLMVDTGLGAFAAAGGDRVHVRGRLSEQVAADWYDAVYLPCLEAVQRAGLPELYASWNPTDADLVLWVYKIRRDLVAQDATVDFDAAAAHARRVSDHERSRRRFRRQGGRVLARRDG